MILSILAEKTENDTCDQLERVNHGAFYSVHKSTKQQHQTGIREENGKWQEMKKLFC